MLNPVILAPAESVMPWDLFIYTRLSYYSCGRPSVHIVIIIVTTVVSSHYLQLEVTVIYIYLKNYKSTGTDVWGNQL